MYIDNVDNRADLILYNCISGKPITLLNNVIGTFTFLLNDTYVKNIRS